MFVAAVAAVDDDNGDEDDVVVGLVSDAGNVAVDKEFDNDPES